MARKVLQMFMALVYFAFTCKAATHISFDTSLTYFGGGKIQRMPLN
jgi:hypothetical protein